MKTYPKFFRVGAMGRLFPDLLTSQLLLRFSMGLRTQGRTVI